MSFDELKVDKFVIKFNSEGIPIDKKGIPLATTLVFGKHMYFNPYLQKWERFYHFSRKIRVNDKKKNKDLKPLKFRTHQRLINIDPRFYHDWARQNKVSFIA